MPGSIGPPTTPFSFSPGSIVLSNEALESSFRLLVTERSSLGLVGDVYILPDDGGGGGGGRDVGEVMDGEKSVLYLHSGGFLLSSKYRLNCDGSYPGNDANGLVESKYPFPAIYCAACAEAAYSG